MCLVMTPKWLASKHHFQHIYTLRKRSYERTCFIARERHKADWGRQRVRLCLKSRKIF